MRLYEPGRRERALARTQASGYSEEKTGASESARGAAGEKGCVDRSSPKKQRRGDRTRAAKKVENHVQDGPNSDSISQFDQPEN